MKSRWKDITQDAVSRQQWPAFSSRRRGGLISNRIPAVWEKNKNIFMCPNGARNLDWLCWGQSQQQITSLILSGLLIAAGPRQRSRYCFRNP
jgi:hypothetical protein